MLNDNSLHQPGSTPDVLGYSYAPGQSPNDPGHPRLEIHLRATPTEQHFDPEQIKFLVVAQLERRVEHLLVTYSWDGPTAYRLVAGLVTMIDRRGKTAEAFTFGGELKIQQIENEVVCTVSSPAPILNLVSTRSVPVMLAQEAEVLFAERRAARAAEPDQYEQRLVAADPVALYLACLAALRERFKHYPTLGDDRMRQFIHFLNDGSHAIPPYLSQRTGTHSLEDIL